MSEPDDFEPEWQAYDDADDEICVDCGRPVSGEDVCGVCGAPMCFACFEMGAGVCKRPHK